MRPARLSRLSCSLQDGELGVASLVSLESAQTGCGCMLAKNMSSGVIRAVDAKNKESCSIPPSFVRQPMQIVLRASVSP